MNEVTYHKFVEPGGKTHEFTLDEMEESIHDIWYNSVPKMPFQLVDDYNGSIVLRFARSMPNNIFEDVFQGEVDALDLIGVVVVAFFEKTEYTLCWAMPIWLLDGPGELFYLGPEGMREII